MLCSMKMNGMVSDLNLVGMAFDSNFILDCTYNFIAHLFVATWSKRVNFLNDFRHLGLLGSFH